MLQWRKITLKFISFGLEKGLAVYLHKLHMDLWYRPSASPQVGLLKLNTVLVTPLICRLTLILKHWTDFIPTVSNNPPSTDKDQTGMIVGISVGVGAVCLVGLLVIFWLVRRKNKRKAFNDEGNVYSLIFSSFSCFVWGSAVYSICLYLLLWHLKLIIVFLRTYVCKSTLYLEDTSVNYNWRLFWMYRAPRYWC